MLYYSGWGFMLLAVIISGLAQWKVSSTYGRFAKVRAKSGISACDAARRILDYNGLSGVHVEQIRGSLTDHYDPRGKVLRLSEAVYHSTSVAALGIAAHEVGHAIQDKEGYLPMRLRGALVPAANIGSQMSWVLVFAGLALGMLNLIDFGILLFCLVLLFQIVTLPVEFNASSRALAALSGCGFLDEEETGQTGQVLSAAALTYIAAVLVSLLQLARLLIMRGRRR